MCFYIKAPARQCFVSQLSSFMLQCWGHTSTLSQAPLHPPRAEMPAILPGGGHPKKRGDNSSSQVRSPRSCHLVQTYLQSFILVEECSFVFHHLNGAFLHRSLGQRCSLLPLTTRWTFRISSEFRMSIARMLVLSCTSCQKKILLFIFHASSATSCLSKMAIYVVSWVM